MHTQRGMAGQPAREDSGDSVAAGRAREQRGCERFRCAAVGGATGPRLRAVRGPIAGGQTRPGRLPGRSNGSRGFSDCNGLSQTTATGPGDLIKPFGEQNGCFNARSGDTPHARRPIGPAGGCCTSQEASSLQYGAAAVAGHTPGWGHTRCVEPSGSRHGP
jgi:hypothetical protein